MRITITAFNNKWENYYSGNSGPVVIHIYIFFKAMGLLKKNQTFPSGFFPGFVPFFRKMQELLLYRAQRSLNNVTVGDLRLNRFR